MRCFLEKKGESGIDRILLFFNKEMFLEILDSYIFLDLFLQVL